MDISPSKSFTDLESIPLTQTAELDYRRFLKIRNHFPTTSTPLDFNKHFKRSANESCEQLFEEMSCSKKSRDNTLEPSQTQDNNTDDHQYHTLQNVELVRPTNNNGLQQTCECQSLHSMIEKVIEKKIDDKFSTLENNIKNSLLRLTEEVVSLRKVLRKTKENNYSSFHEMKTPFSNKENFLSFEKEIQGNEEKFNSLCQFYSQTNCTDPKKFVKQNWQKTMVDKLAEEFCWRGTATKNKVQGLTTTLALRNAFHGKYNDSEETFNLACKSFFQYAKDRQKKKGAPN